MLWSETSPVGWTLALSQRGPHVLISTTLLEPFILPPPPGKLLTVLQGSVCLNCLSLFTSFWRYLSIGSNIYGVSFAFPGSVGECVDSNNWSIE